MIGKRGVVIRDLTGRLIAHAVHRIKMVLGYEVRTLLTVAAAPPPGNAAQAEHCRATEASRLLAIILRERLFGHHFERQLIEHIIKHMIVGAAVRRALPIGPLPEERGLASLPHAPRQIVGRGTVVAGCDERQQIAAPYRFDGMRLRIAAPVLIELPFVVGDPLALSCASAMHLQ